MTARETLLLTGATGHLGAAIARQALAQPGARRLRLLIRDEEKLRALAAADPDLAPLLDCERVVADIRDAPRVEAALAGVDAVIHACHSHEYWRGSKHLLEVNVGGARNLARALAGSSRVRKVVYVGSYSAHGTGAGGGEMEAARLSARECSSRSKRLAQEVFLAAAAGGRFRLDVVSPSYMIGPLQIDPTYFGALFHLVLLKPLRWCPPNGINLIDVRDVARTVLACAAGDHAEGRRVLASGENVPLQDLFAEMNRQAGFARAPRKLPGRLFGLMPSFKQFGRFGRHYFRKDHYVEGAGLGDRCYTLAESVRDSLSWARHRPLYRHRGEFLLWLAQRYLF